MCRIFFLICSIIHLSIYQSHSQDIPLLSQKITSNSAFNPAATGSDNGSISVSYRDNFSTVPNSPNTFLLSLSSPILVSKVGVTTNIFQDRVNFLSTTIVNLGISYRILHTKSGFLSAGLSTEMTYLRLVDDTNFDNGNLDPVLVENDGRLRNYDFGAGMLFTTQFFEVMFSANRLSSGWNKHSLVGTNLFGSITGKLPLFSTDDLFEPYLIFRKLSSGNNYFSTGFYYTCFDRITAGLGFASGRSINYYSSFRVDENISLGYAIQDYFGRGSKSLGLSHEVIIRVDFNRKSKEKLRIYNRPKQSKKSQISRNPIQLRQKKKRKK